MPRIYRKQKECEQFLICEFLCDLGYHISSPKWKQERPDALLTLRKGKSNKRVAIEHTDYFNDTKPGKRSPLTPISEFWELVQASLIRRISHRKHLAGISARVKLNRGLSKPNNPAKLAKQLAAELVDFVETHPVGQSAHVHWTSRDFQQHRTLQSVVTTMLLSRSTNDETRAFRCRWTCDNLATGVIGLNLDHIKAAIKKKNEKANSYKNWGDANEKWLLIAASGSNLSNHAGLPDENVNWADSTLLNLCRNSPFDRIVFWERIRNWYKWLKPSKKVVQYNPPYIK